jgi:hypothetical protein
MTSSDLVQSLRCSDCHAASSLLREGCCGTNPGSATSTMNVRQPPWGHSYITHASSATASVVLRGTHKIFASSGCKTFATWQGILGQEESFSNVSASGLGVQHLTLVAGVQPVREQVVGQRPIHDEYVTAVMMEYLRSPDARSDFQLIQRGVSRTKRRVSR